MIKLWLDDIRPMPENFDVCAKSADEAITILKSGTVTHISLDHDLGDVESTDGDIVLWHEHEKTGYDVAKWIERQAYLGLIPKMTYAIHSANPVGVEKIKTAMQKADRYWNSNKR